MSKENTTKKKSAFADSAKEKFQSFKNKINTPFVQRIGNRLIERKHLFPSFAFPVLLLLIVYAALQIFPFGDKSILTLDMRAQYIFYFEQIRDVLTGKASLIYTFERTLGGEFLGYYAYYIASPLSWIVALFPERLIVEAVTFIMILKCGLSGLFFAYYLEQTKRKIDMTGYAIFSTMYALCAYAMAYQANTMWMDGLMLLPLVTLGIEKLVTDGKFKLFIISFALLIWSNYYIGYMCCIYVLIYFICFICAHKTEEINNLNETKHIFKSFVRIAICSLIAILITMAIILSAYYSLSFGKNDFQQSNFKPTLRFDFLDLFAKFFLGAYDTVRPDGLPNVYSGLLVLFMVPIYLMSKKVSSRHKIAYGILCAVFIASFSINTIDLVWHGFQMPVWLNYRYSFMFTFVLLTMAYRGYESFAEFSSKIYLQIGVILIALLMVIQKVVNFNIYIGGQNNPGIRDYEFIWLSIGFIAVYVAVIHFAKNPKILKQTAATALLTVVLVETGVGAGINWAREVYECGYGLRNDHVQFLDDLQPTVDEIKLKDNTFYRMEKTQYRANNENLALDINGIAASTSTLNASVIELLANMGFSASSHWAKYFSGNEVADSLFGFKYIISNETTPVSSLYEQSVSSDGLYVYKNPYALSIAYASSIKGKDLKLTPEPKLSPFEYLNLMITKLSGNPSSADVFDQCTYLHSNAITLNCTKSITGRNVTFTRRSETSSAYFTYKITAKHDGSVYMYLHSSAYNPVVTYYVNDVETSTFFDTDTKRIHNIGNFKAGEEIVVKFKFDAATVTFYNDVPSFVQVNKENLETAIDYLDDGNLKITEYSDTKFEGTITAKKDQYVFTTIPYDKYWNVYVDGVKVDTYKSLDSLLSFDITEGEHEIKMVYVSAPFYLGLCVSAVGVIFFIVLIMLERLYGFKVLPIKVIEEKNASKDGEDDTDGNDNGDSDAPSESDVSEKMQEETQDDIKE